MSALIDRTWQRAALVIPFRIARISNLGNLKKYLQPILTFVQQRDMMMLPETVHEHGMTEQVAFQLRYSI
jgi:hypothetical protein